MHNPVSTYRIQFHKGFTLSNLEKIVPYLSKMGIGTLYASPIFEATPASNHGYDGVNPHQINPEVGSEEELKKLNQELRKNDIGWLQDIVPNHMAFHPKNKWLMDVLEKGQRSLFASFFDMAGTSSLFKGKLMVPFLGAPLETVLTNKELKVAVENEQLVIRYYDATYPLNLDAYRTILKRSEPDSNNSIQALIEQISSLSGIEEASAYSRRYDENKLQFASLIKEGKNSLNIQKILEAVNDDPDLLKSIVDDQEYRLCFWQETDQKINFRRFFTVNGLICLNIQDQSVFKQYHEFIKSLIEEKVFDGLRIDHVDGLYDPTQYLIDLRELVGPETYIVVEKILESGEKLPEQWPIQGETGYGFLSIVNNLFTNTSNKDKFVNFYQKLINDKSDVHRQISEKKALILKEHMGGELENLLRFFLDLNLIKQDELESVDQKQLKEAIGEFLIECPVYRYYGNQLPLREDESKSLKEIFKSIRNKNASLTEATGILEDIIIEKPSKGNEEYNQQALKFYQRLMQFSGPLMAKGVEDTLMYTYNNFIAHNEVGDAPDAFGISIPDFHEIMLDRQQNWPLAINTTSTHDTKRGEDVRMRLNVLSDLAEEWFSNVRDWREMNEPLKNNNKPDVNDEYFIYQTIAGAYPMPGEEEDNFAGRIQEYLQKAFREAKVNSNWTSPNEEYEAAAKKFAVSLLDKKGAFWKTFTSFHQKISDFGIINSLSQVILKFTCPGVADVYQGTELWDLSLVDPDNRRLVDYEKRLKLLEEFDENNDDQDTAALWKNLWEERYNAKIKLSLIRVLFNARKNNPELFEKGKYLPLEVEGQFKDHIFAFAREYQQKFCVVVVPLSVATLCENQKCDIASFDWKDTKVLLPDNAAKDFQNVIIDIKGKADGFLSVQELFQDIPFAVLQFESKQERGGGVLLHITSLPSPFGIGDLGAEARKFADFLHRTRQTYWQLLPLNPTEKAQFHSPYSSISSMAGNPLLISPELLVKEGLLAAKDLEQHYLPQEDKVDFEAASKAKAEMFTIAWGNLKKNKFENLRSEFQTFCDKEAKWLDDFAVYMLVKEKQGGDPWYKWPDDLKLKKPGAVEAIVKENTDAFEKTKWLQFIFFKQWKSLRAYCNKRGIQLFGDVPIYISYDSVDVWSNKEIFMLDEAGNMTGVAGVPPDYFNEDGQLWGMPVFKWDVLKQQDYEWWMQRLRVNMALFDLIRLDHFRAFADYWEVPAGEETAKNGTWKKGPGADFFNTAKAKLGELPFIAEDLGEINDAVLELRDEFKFPGMKVLQFAFGDEMPQSPYIPHNYTNNFIAYTGTHDNNTVLGWYRQEGHKHHSQLEQYMGRELSEADIYWALGKLAFSSVAKIAIIPIQDLLNLDETARMNLPGAVEKNWLWRLKPGQITKEAEKRLKEWTILYNR